MKMSLFLAVLLSMLMAPSLSEAHTATLQSVISGRVWIDANDDGGFDAGEVPLPNVQVLLQKDGRAFAETLTNSNGEYQFDGLEPGAYVMTMIDGTLPAEYRSGENEVYPRDIPDDNTDYTIEKNFRITITEIAVPLTVTGRVWADAARQQPLPGVAVQLAHPTGEVLATVTTDNQGRYAFPSNQLDAANWVVSVVQWPAGYTPATPEQIPIRLSLGDPQRVANFGFFSGTQDTTRTDTTQVDTTQVDTAQVDTAQVAEAEGISPWLYIVPLLILLGVGAYLFLRSRRPPARPAAAPINFLEEFLKFRDEKAWSKMYELLEEMPASLAQTPLVRQQHAFALNRDGNREEAERVLRELLDENGASPETNGILGRVHKDRWLKARNAGQTEQAAEHLDQALKTYLDGHAADPTNPYPGLNALTLMEFSNPPPDQREALLKEVTAAVQARPQDNPYWDHATRLELAVLGGNESEARAALADAVAAMRVVWEIETTLNNLELIRSAREERGTAIPGWVGEVETALEHAMGDA